MVTDSHGIGKHLRSKAPANDEAKLCVILTILKPHGRVVFVLDQPATIGVIKSKDRLQRRRDSITHRNEFSDADWSPSRLRQQPAQSSRGIAKALI
jgi:hypothetical protein